MPDHNTDARFLQHALDLARRGIGLTSPNPCVGAVVVNDGKSVGEGFHTYDGVRHAEVIALEKAGEKSRGATLYVNLEPCSHQGRTGPCVDAIIKAKIGRVVASMQDPNPLVYGKGFEHLRAAGIEVEAGVLEAEARALNETFAKYIRHRTPLVTLKAAMSLDGKISAGRKTGVPSGTISSGDNWITGEASRAKVHQMRHQSDSILAGVGTVLADDPLLTDRSGLPRRRKLLRVILDSRLRLPLKSRVVQTAEEDVIVLCSLPEEVKRRKLQKAGVRVEQLPAGAADGRPDMAGIIAFLGGSEISSVLIEGGAHVNWAALTADVVDKMFLFYAPVVLGAEGAIPLVAGTGFRGICDAARAKKFSLHRFGGDFAFEGYLRDPYES